MATGEGMMVYTEMELQLRQQILLHLNLIVGHLALGTVGGKTFPEILLLRIQ